MKNKRLSPFIKAILFITIIIVMHLFQFTVIPFTGLPFPLLLMLPMGIALSMEEKEFAGALYGILIGALWDLSSPVTDGLWTLLFPVIFCIAGLLTHYTLRNTLLTAMIFTLALTVIYLAIVSLYELDKPSYEVLSAVFRSRWLPCTVTSLVICIPEYYLARKISDIFNPDNVTF